MLDNNLNPSGSVLKANSSLRGLAQSGAIAGVIKLGSAGLSFLMFLSVALITDERQFGLFSAAYAGASLISFFATIGQQSAVLRFWPQYVGAGKIGKAQSFMVRSILVITAGMVVSSLSIVLVGFLPWPGTGTPEWLPLCLSAAVLSFALAWSEFASGALRAKSALISALLPRDIIWRGLVIACIGVLLLQRLHISAVEVTVLCAGLLVLSVAPQAVGLIRSTLAGDKEPLSHQEKAEFNQVTLGLWGITSLPPALGQVSTLLVAAILGPEIAGGVFVADRTTRLVMLAMTGLNQALAPEISNAFHNGRTDHVQRIVGLTALGSTIIALLTLAVFWLFGDLVLGVFDHAYANPTMKAVLVILALGATIGAACGPIELVMQLTGAQNVLLRIVLIVNCTGLFATALVTYLFGPLGAAIGIAGTVAVWNVTAVLAAQRRVRLDTSVVGALKVLWSSR